ncbi:hypothetical protein [Weissella sp. LMG 11983]|uniref:hypothetical protein n=1 Tax=Weissella sp. LMG 11983 TaxID=2987700 RepID=UPI0021F81F22|nr:hypothetical protein [Weissella sp. LMG 11983]MCW0925950.1 hypothetical protein [Weissella sp. LMG 11983]
MEKLRKMPFEDMDKKFREHRNFHKLAAKLVDYGYVVSWLPVDDKGADIVAVHTVTSDVIKIQLKGRVTIDSEYFGKNIYMAFPKSDSEPNKNWVIVPHDELVKIYTTPENWQKNQGKSSGSVPNKIWGLIWGLVKEMSVVEPLNF